MQFLQQALDDPEPQPCGRCSVCTGDLPAPGPRPVDRDRGGRPPVLPRPGRGRRAAQAVGRAGCPTARAGSPVLAPGPGARVRRRPGLGARAGRAVAAATRPAPPAVLDGLVEVLKRWSKSWERPVAVVAMPSRRFPALVGSVAEHLATVGRLPLVDALAVTGPPPGADSSSSVRAGPARPDQPARRASGLRRAGAAGRRHHPDPLDGHRRRVVAGRRRRDGGAAAGRAPAALTQGRGITHAQ